MGRERLDLKTINGGKFGWLRAVKPAPDKSPGKTAWYFKCTRCKRKTLAVIETSAVMHMGQKACSCRQRDVLAAGTKKRHLARLRVTERYVRLRDRGMTVTEIARKCGVPRSTVHYHIKHAEKKRANRIVPRPPRRNQPAAGHRRRD